MVIINGNPQINHGFATLTIVFVVKLVMVISPPTKHYCHRGKRPKRKKIWCDLNWTQMK